MTLKDLDKKTNMISFEKIRKQRALSAASSLMYQLQIPEGNHLAFLLNQPEAKTNKEAISLWILSRLVKKMVSDKDYVELMNGLERVLIDCETGIY